MTSSQCWTGLKTSKFTLDSSCIVWLKSGPPGIPVQKLENSPAQYQNSRKFPFLKYSKTSHKRTFRSVNSSISSAGFSQTAVCRTSNGNFLNNRFEQIINKQKRCIVLLWNEDLTKKSFFCSLKNAHQCLHAVE